MECSSRSSSNYLYGDINLLHVTKEVLEHCKIKFQFTSWTKYLFRDVVIFGSTSVFVNISFRFCSHCVVHHKENQASNCHKFIPYTIVIPHH